MVDYSLNNQFDFHGNGAGQFKTVRGREEFQQNVIKELHFRLDGLVGLNFSSNVFEERVSLIVNRIAEESQIIEGVEEVSIDETNEKNRISLKVVYDSGDSFQETI